MKVKIKVNFYYNNKKNIFGNYIDIIVILYILCIGSCDGILVLLGLWIKIFFVLGILVEIKIYGYRKEKI